jgi:hypothetical protein
MQLVSQQSPRESEPLPDALQAKKRAPALEPGGQTAMPRATAQRLCGLRTGHSAADPPSGESGRTGRTLYLLLTSFDTHLRPSENTSTTYTPRGRPLRGIVTVAASATVPE